jgi:hypothetical protein
MERRRRPIISKKMQDAMNEQIKHELATQTFTMPGAS